MHQYRVVESRANEGLLALRCQRGHYHVARALNAMPPPDACLCGGKPHLGFGVLLCTVSGALFKVIFESVDQPEPRPTH